MARPHEGLRLRLRITPTSTSIRRGVQAHTVRTPLFCIKYLAFQLFFITFASMMRIDIITVLPEMLEGFIGESILARARKKGLAEVHLHNLRDYTLDKWRRVDDYPYGGSAGMVMQCEPIDRCITALKAEREYDDVIYVSPDGETFNQKIANEMSLQGNLIILCGHYKGIDQRIRDHFITREISVGDYVLTGGELAAAIIADAVIRLVPVSSATSRVPSPTASRTTSSLRPSIPALPTTRDGRCRKYC